MGHSPLSVSIGLDSRSRLPESSPKSNDQVPRDPLKFLSFLGHPVD